MNNEYYSVGGSPVPEDLNFQKKKKKKRMEFSDTRVICIYFQERKAVPLISIVVQNVHLNM